MNEREQNIEVQISCPLCKSSLPIRVKSLEGRLHLSFRCPHCKRISEITLQDIK